jgi:hypothetical protein
LLLADIFHDTPLLLMRIFFSLSFFERFSLHYAMPDTPAPPIAALPPPFATPLLMLPAFHCRRRFRFRAPYVDFRLLSHAIAEIIFFHAAAWLSRYFHADAMILSFQMPAFDADSIFS